MTKPNEHAKIHDAMRDAFRSNRFTVDNRGRVLRGPDEETAPETGPTEGAPPKRPGKADGGAHGHIPVDPNASINRAIRAALDRRGT